jgi:hypothetical protein
MGWDVGEDGRVEVGGGWELIEIRGKLGEEEELVGRQNPRPAAHHPMRSTVKETLNEGRG